MIFLPSSYEWDTIYIHLWKPKSSWRAIWKRPRPEGHVLPLLVARACELLPHLDVRGPGCFTGIYKLSLAYQFDIEPPKYDV